MRRCGRPRVASRKAPPHQTEDRRSGDPWSPRFPPWRAAAHQGAGISGAPASRRGAGGPMLPARRASRHRMCVHDLLGCRSSGPGRSLLWTQGTPLSMDSPELVAVSCPKCRCSPVEVLKKLRSGRRFLWCPQCRAIWAVNTWVVNRPAPLSEDVPQIIAFGPRSMRRPL
jgi:hypothetical protein